MYFHSVFQIMELKCLTKLFENRTGKTFNIEKLPDSTAHFYTILKGKYKVLVEVCEGSLVGGCDAFTANHLDECSCIFSPCDRQG